jgi:hypothetical protein
MMDNGLSMTEDVYPEATSLCRSGPQALGQMASGTGSGRRSRRVHFLCRHTLRFAVFLVVFALLIPLVSCPLDASHRVVKAGELKKLMDTSLPVLIVDNRSEYEYNRGHLPKAINIPQERLFSLDNLLPKDKGLPIVFYCTGSG